MWTTVQHNKKFKFTTKKKWSKEWTGPLIDMATTWFRLVSRRKMLISKIIFFLIQPRYWNRCWAFKLSHIENVEEYHTLYKIMNSSHCLLVLIWNFMSSNIVRPKSKKPKRIFGSNLRSNLSELKKTSSCEYLLRNQYYISHWKCEETSLYL